jgi:hypothetical protein
MTTPSAGSSEPHPGPSEADREAFDEYSESLPLIPGILVKDVSDPQVTARPDRWRSLDELVARWGTRFTKDGVDYDITDAVQGQLGKGRVAILALIDPTTPRLPTPQERAVLGPVPPAPSGGGC